jgi:hypothetical protein
MQYFFLALIIFIGIWLTGFNKVHWFLYVPVAFLVFSGATGISLGLKLWRLLGLK